MERAVADIRYDSKQALWDLAAESVRAIIAEPDRKLQKWTGESAAQTAVYANPRWVATKTAKTQSRKRGEVIERSFTSSVLYDTCGT